MRNPLLLLVAVIVLYLGISLALHGVYGPSYGFLEYDDCWKPDGSGGWVKYGEPDEPMPGQSSEQVPLLAEYLPLWVPGLLLAVFLFTPLRRYLEPPKPEGEALPEDFDGNPVDAEDDTPTERSE